MTAPHLAPHDAELVEADAARIYEENAPDDAGPWETVPEQLKGVFRAFARNPYGNTGRPRT